MKKILLLFFISALTLTAVAQPSGILNETFNLKYIETTDLFFTPNGENPNLTIYEVAGNYIIEANGIVNTLNAAASFNGNSLTLNDYGITLQDCLGPNCYYEDLYFYNILTTQNFQSKTFTYYYNERNGYKYLSFRDSNYNLASYSTEPAPEPDPLLFQTWYLYRVDVDLGDPVFYNGPDAPKLTINEDFTYTGIESCALISGNFILGNGSDYYEFLLQPNNYLQDESNCNPGEAEYVLYDLQNSYPLGSNIYEDGSGIYVFEYETAAGFISYFQNQPLSTNDNNFSDFSVYPNPVKNKLIIRTANNDFDSVSIIDINGRVVKSIKEFSSNEIDVSTLKAGIYFITIDSSEGKVTKKFIKN